MHKSSSFFKYFPKLFVTERLFVNKLNLVGSKIHPQINWCKCRQNNYKRLFYSHSVSFLQGSTISSHTLHNIQSILFWHLKVQKHDLKRVNNLFLLTASLTDRLIKNRNDLIEGLPAIMAYLKFISAVKLRELGHQHLNVNGLIVSN